MLRVHARLWVGIALSLALVPVAQAQNIDATSRQNVVGSGTADRAGIESRRQALFQRMLADPSSLDLAFEYAALSEQVGDLEAAISTLERMRVFAPGLPRLQFELGVLYYRLGSWSTAKSYFTTVMQQPIVPDDGAIAATTCTLERRASIVPETSAGLPRFLAGPGGHCDKKTDRVQSDGHDAVNRAFRGCRGPWHRGKPRRI